MPRTAFLFPGQGAQKVGMAQDLCTTLPAGLQLFKQASDILGYDLLEVCTNGPEERLNATDVCQPAIFVASLAALESLRVNEPEAEAECVACAGLSLGEYTALAYAGAFSFADGVRLVRLRGEAMQAAANNQPGTMVSVLGMERPDLEQLCQQVQAERAQGEVLQLANLLCPGNLVVSGHHDACEELERRAGQSGARTVRLSVAGAFHTSLMKPADSQLADALASVSFSAPRIPVWSNVDRKPHSDPEEIRALLVRQVLEPVLWEDTLRGLLADGCERFYELGPGRVLAGLLKRVQRKADCRNITA